MCSAGQTWRPMANLGSSKYPLGHGPWAIYPRELKMKWVT